MSTISVIVHTLNRYDCLGSTLRSLSVQTVQPHEIVIADQTPAHERPDGFYEGFSALPIRLLNLDRPSHAPACNAAARLATGDVLLFLDDDMEFGATWLESFERILLQENLDVLVGAVSDLVSLPDASHRDLSRFDPVTRLLKCPTTRWSGMTLAVHGGNTCIRRELFLACGGFDEFIPRMMDIELGYRLYLQGAKMYYSPIPFAHHRRWQSGGTRIKRRDMIRTRLAAKVYIHRKHFPGWATTQYLIYEAINCLAFRIPTTAEFRPAHLLRPWMPLHNLWRLLCAHRDASRLLRLARQATAAGSGAHA